MFNRLYHSIINECKSNYQSWVTPKRMMNSWDEICQKNMCWDEVEIVMVTNFKDFFSILIIKSWTYLWTLFTHPLNLSTKFFWLVRTYEASKLWKWFSWTSKLPKNWNLNLEVVQLGIFTLKEDSYFFKIIQSISSCRIYKF